VLRVPESARVEIAGRFDVFDADRPLAVIHPGCSMPARTYPWEGFAAIAGLLVERVGARVVVTGSATESKLVERVVGAVPPLARGSVRPAAGALSFPGLCALIERADLVVTNNTGPMHVAAAVQTPVIALFALTNPPEQWGPWRAPHRLLNHDVPCRICYSRICPTTHDCLRLVAPDDVLAAADDLLAERRPAQLALAGAGSPS
ncbi:MAG TPA: glycosyltransferase family 9 protein, partial [Thermomicrobiales bacterium]|nr:glycosyltransferase family 9 protein [Thermomicrobiales bacterium]